MTEDNTIPDEILREWITKAKPLVDSAWNLAIDNAKLVAASQTIHGHSVVTGVIDNIIRALDNLKKDIK